MKNLNLILFVLFVFLVSCKKNINESIEVDPPIPPIIGNNYTPVVIPINSSVVGIIVDENGQPVEDAIISLNNQTQISDPFGSFRFTDETMNENGTFLKVEKTGYFESGRRFFPTSAAIHNVRIQLIEKNFNQSFQSSTGGTVTFENGGEIIFPQNSIKTEDGNPYSGEVNVALKWLDPTATATVDEMPGTLQGVTIQGEEMVLETYGMIAVELESTSGEALNIIESQTAQIKMPVPQNILDNAPDEIPLWSFNYDYGIWAEDGKAMLQNGFYIGEVEHFSFWNCDFPRTVVDFSLTLIDVETQEPIPNTKLNLTIPNSGLTSSGDTNAEGVVSGKVPLGVLLELQVLDFCGDAIHSQNVGPFSDATDLSLEINVENNTIISGNIIDCDGAITTEGALIVNLGGRQLNVFIDSSPFEISIPTCQSTTEISVSGGNLVDIEQGDFITFPVADSVSVGDLIACGNDLMGFAVVTLDSTTTIIVDDLKILNGIPQNILDFGSTASGRRILLSFPDNAVGDYSMTHDQAQFLITDEGFLSVQKLEYFEILEYGDNVGDLISGKGHGYVQNTYGGASNIVHVSMEFSFIRNF